jgi:outer membrane protein TolC
LSAAQFALAADVAARTYTLREATRHLALLDNQLLPKSRQSLEVARAGYLAGRIDFFNLIDAERTWLGFQLDRVEVATQREVVLTELSLIVQGMPPAGAAMGVRGATPTSAARPRALSPSGGM